MKVGCVVGARVSGSGELYVPCGRLRVWPLACPRAPPTSLPLCTRDPLTHPLLGCPPQGMEASMKAKEEQASGGWGWGGGGCGAWYRLPPPPAPAACPRSAAAAVLRWCSLLHREQHSAALPCSPPPPFTPPPPTHTPPPANLVQVKLVTEEVTRRINQILEADAHARALAVMKVRGGWVGAWVGGWVGGW